MTELLTADAAARLRALEPQSFIVEAPAGAGKTELLTQRVLGLLARVDHPEEVVALTFTNKAAAEMRDRILSSLELAATGERPGDEAPHRQLTYDLGRTALARDAEQGWKLLAHPGRLAVTTLDSLCASLARQMPYLSRFGTQPGIAEDATPHYEAAARRTLALVEDAGPQADTVAAALAFMDNDAGRLERLLVALLARRDQWLRHTARGADADLRAEAEAGLAALVRRDLAAAAAVFDAPLQESLRTAARFAGATLAAENPESPIARLENWDRLLDDDPATLPLWQGLADLLLTADDELRKSLDKRQGLPVPAGREHKAALKALLDALPAEAAAALAPVRELPLPVYADEEWATVEVFSHLLNLATAQLWLAFQEAGEVDFAEVAQRAVAALGDDEAPTDLALALDYRIRHLLVDEFQDTSPAQIRLVASLIRGWDYGRPGGDERSLFLVGDPMQSIYRFRKADVGLFLKVRDGGIGDLRPEKLCLYRNNRSRPQVVAWINATFPGVFPARDEPLHGAVRYAPCMATRPEEENSGVALHPILLDADAEADGGEREADLLIDLILAERQRYPDASVAVLVRARSHLAPLLARLRQRAPQLPFQAVDMAPLASRQAIQDVLSLARALLHRDDRVHWLAILRAPWCGLTLADLHALAGDDHRSTVWQLARDEGRLARLSPDGQTRLRHTASVLAEALAQQGRCPPRRWLEGTWRSLGGDRCLAEDERADVEALFQRLDTLGSRGTWSADALETEAARLFAPPDPSPAALALPMMTLHKAKGLEFDTVIVPGLHRASGRDDPPLLLWDEIPAEGTREHLVVAPLRARGSARTRISPYAALARLEAERARHESERLLYVAATRARRRLHLVGVATVREGALRTPAAGSFLRLLWEHGAEKRCAEVLATTQASPAVAGQIALTEPTADLRRLALADLPTPSPRPAAGPARSGGAEGEGSGPDAAVGSLVHRVLELIARDGPEAWSAARVAERRAAFAAWLRDKGLAPREADAGAARTVTILQGVLASPTGRWILSPHPDARAEWALSSAAAEGRHDHVVDRCFTADGQRWIVDYKTLRLTSAAPADLLARAATHRPQLERYAALFPSAGRPLRLAVYFVEQDRLIDLSGAEEKIIQLPASGFFPAP
ncbi:MAG: UvrD-helicase domain-containing protein [Dechloromonas sp.]|nr:UvrD-helicase domain-containing protein [Dechloromonas sp.]